MKIQLFVVLMFNAFLVSLGLYLSLRMLEKLVSSQQVNLKCVYFQALVDLSPVHEEQ